MLCPKLMALTRDHNRDRDHDSEAHDHDPKSSDTKCRKNLESDGGPGSPDPGGVVAAPTYGM